MSKSSAPPQRKPWIPPGRSRHVHRSQPKPVQEDVDISVPNTSVGLKILEEDILEQNISLCSSTFSNGKPEELTLYLRNIKQEHKVLNLYYMSLRPYSQFLNRFFCNVNIKDVAVKKLLAKVEGDLNKLVKSFEDLEYSISLFENTVFGNSNSEDLPKIVKLKESLLLKVLGCYNDILTVFQVAFDELNAHDTIQQERERDSFKKQLMAFEKKYLTQTATMKDLERRLAILQCKYSTIESYNSTLEEAKAEMQKVLHLKDVQIRNLTSEINQFPLKHSDDRLIGVIEEIKSKAQAEKTALKKALKVQKWKTEQKEQLHKKLEEDIDEKVKMMFELASQRDKLKIQMTVVNNKYIQAKYQVEEIKSQKLKLQNEVSENEIFLKNKFQEETDDLKKQLHTTTEDNLQMKKTIKGLEEELQAVTNELQTLKSSHSNRKTSLSETQNGDSDAKADEEVRKLVSLLQDFRNMKIDVAAKGDTIEMDTSPNMENVLMVVQDIKRQLQEFKKPNFHDNISDKSNAQNKLDELKHSNKVLSEENASLKLQFEKLKSTSSNAEQAPTLEDYSAGNMDTNFSTKTLQMELNLKTEEVWRIRQREKKLECQLEEVKDKLQIKERENCRLFTLEESLKKNEEELRCKKMELSLLEQKKEEESERLLRRTKELQEALDEMTTNNESLQRYVDMLKSSLYNVFGDS